MPIPFFLSGEHKSVKVWFDHVAGMQGCKSAAQKVLQGKGLQGMKSYLQRQPAPPSRSQCRETQPCNSNPAEVRARSSGELLDFQAFLLNRKASVVITLVQCLRTHVDSVRWKVDCVLHAIDICTIMV